VVTAHKAFEGGSTLFGTMQTEAKALIQCGRVKRRIHAGFMKPVNWLGLPSSKRKLGDRRSSERVHPNSP